MHLNKASSRLQIVRHLQGQLSSKIFQLNLYIMCDMQNPPFVGGLFRQKISLEGEREREDERKC